MTALPLTTYTPIIRTWFGDDKKWLAALAAATSPSVGDGFIANLSVIDDPAFDSADPNSLPMVCDGGHHHALLIIADERGQNEPDFPLLCLSTIDGWSLRVIAREVWGIENNLSLANMDAADFVRAAASDGVFRGF